MLFPTHFISGPLLYFYLSDNGAICDHLTREQSALARHHSSTDIHTISAEKHTEKERERCSLVYVPPVNALIVM